MSTSLKFKVSSGLKDIIGRELITDDFIAVFELVKNGFDARALEVSITFNDIYGINPSIVIEDNGKGMSIEDLTNKWLFVAYSAKRDGSEEDDDSNDYRAKLRSVRAFAGAKGIGRFSCDRLGEGLTLTTRRPERGSPIECVQVNWTDFEKNPKVQFGNILVNHSTIKKSSLTYSHGTRLEIANLRSKWDRSKLLRLKRSLEKLINPNEDDDKSFSVIIHAEDEITEDNKLAKNNPERINGIIRNTVFERLKLKTTEIHVVIPEDGETIKTTLTDRGEKIYSITEINTSGLHNISISLFNLDTTAKTNFTRLMGIAPVNFGSVFMYKNGFRIYPFGEVGDDSLGIDVRKAQGFRRNLGTRELIGRIEIHGTNEDLKETSSRVGGHIRNDSYEALKSLFWDKALRRLEKYVVDVIQWGAEIEDPATGERREIRPSDVKEDILKVIAGLTSSKDVINIDFDSKSFGVVESRQEKSLSKLVRNISRIAQETNNPNLSQSARIVAKRVEELQDEASIARTVLTKTEGELQRTVGENLFLRSVTSTDIKEVLGLQHQIGHSTQRIEDEVTTLRESIEKGIDGKGLKSHLEIIALENKKIATIARFVTKANFNLNSVSITQDLASFIVQYVENVYKDYPHLKVNRKLPTIIVTQNGSQMFRLKFSPLEIVIIMDNLLNNAQKAGARIVNIDLSVEKGEFNILVSDDGKGIPEDKLNKIFDFGYTTTNGSGIGLYHVKQLVSKLHGKVKVVSDSSGTKFLITFKNDPAI